MSSQEFAEWKVFLANEPYYTATHAIATLATCIKAGPSGKRVKYDKFLPRWQVRQSPHQMLAIFKNHFRMQEQVARKRKR